LILLSLPATAQLVHLSENFDTTDFRPGWTVDSTGDAWKTWHIVEDLYGFIDIDSNIAIVYDYSGNAFDEKLISPTQNITGYHSLYLVYDWIFMFQSTASKGLVEVFDGSNWQEIKLFDSLDASGHDSIDITAYQNYTLQVRFRFVNPTGNGWESDFAIDNVKILTPPTISIGTPIPTEICQGGSVRLSFNVNDTEFGSGNVFTIEASDSGGDFSSPIVLDTIQDIATGLYLQSYLFPTNTIPGSHYKIRVKASNPSYISDTIDENIIVKKNPVVNLGDNQMLCANDYANLNAGTGHDSYLWSTGENTQSVIFDTTGYGIGAHNVWVTIDSNGCYARDTVVIEFGICPGFAQIETEKIQLYPVPVKDILHITCNACSINKAILSTADGTVIKTTRKNPIDYIDFTDLRAGHYIIQLFENDQLAAIRSVVKCQVSNNK
jgi:hypothetical protein